MRREDWDTVMRGERMGASGGEADDNPGDSGGEQVIVGAHGEERPTRDVEQDYSARDKEFIADAADEREDGLLADMVRGGLKLKVHREEPPPPKSEEEKQRDLVLEVAEDRKQRLERSEAELGDHKTSRAALEDLAYVEEMVGQGRVTGEQALAEQQRVLDRIEEIEDDSLRHQTLESAVAFGYVPEPLYEQHVERLQHRYAEHQMSEYEARAKQTEQEIEREGEIQEAVIGWEEQKLNKLGGLAQTIARQMIEENGESIAAMGARDTFLALSEIRHLAALVADSIESDNIQADIVRAFPGEMRPDSGWGNFSRRERREFDVHALGLASDPWTPEIQELARQRAEAEVARDIKLAQRHKTHGLSGKEQADLARSKLAAQISR